MSESTTDTMTDVQPEGQAGDTTTDINADTGASEQDATYWRKRARQHEDRAKALADKAKKFDEWQTSQQTEAEKTAQRIADAERKAAEAESRLLRQEVAAAKGLTTDQAKRLVGSTREELESDADELLAAFKASARTADFGGGNRGQDIGPGARQWTKADLEGKSADEINAARKAGHLDRLMGKTT